MEKNTYLWIIGIVILLLVLKSTLPSEPFSITTDYYKDGRKVSGLFSTFIQYDQIRLNLHASNDGQLKISDIKLVSATPEIFNNSLPKISFETLEVGEKNKLVFTSNFIDANTLASLPQPVVFWAKISGKDEFGTTYTEETTFSLSFIQEVGGGTIFSGGIATLSLPQNTGRFYTINNMATSIDDQEYLQQDANIVIPRDGVLKNLYVNVHTHQYGAGAYFTIMKNGYGSGVQAGGSYTDLAVTFGYQEKGLKSDTTHSVPVSAGDVINMNVGVGDAVTPAMGCSWAVTLE